MVRITGTGFTLYFFYFFSSFRNLFQSLNEKNIPYFFCEALHQQWELLVQNMLCDLQGLVTGFVHKITDMTIQRRKWSEIKSFMIVMPPSLNAILSIQMKWLCSWIILVKTRKHFTYSSSISIVFFFSFLFFSSFFFLTIIYIFF